MIGRKQAIGPVFETPTSPSNQPHWKTATTVPKLAATDSRNPIAAFTGTISDRNTASNSSSDRPTTMMPNGTSAELSFSATSTPTAVLPVTEICAPVLALIAAASSRMSRTTVCVWVAAGAVDGTAWISAALLSALTRAADTDTTPGAFLSIVTTWAACACAADWLDVSVSSAITSSGPLNPGPNDEVIVSKVVRWVLPLAAEPLSGSDNLRPNAGIANTTRTVTARPSASAGRRTTLPNQRSPSVGLMPSGSCSACAVRAASRAARDSGLGDEPVVGDTEDRRQQGVRDQYRADDRAGGRQPHDGQERDADDRQRRQGDDDGGAGEHDRRTGRTDGETGRLAGRQAAGQLRAVPRHDEQRVVDPDGETDHRRQGDRGR